LSVDQVSRPVLIVLLATVALAGAWFTVLRPKTDSGSGSTPAATAPGMAGLGNAISKANGAVAASEAAAKRSEAAANAAAGGTATATTPTPAAATKPGTAAATKPAPAAASGGTAAPTKTAPAAHSPAATAKPKPTAVAKPKPTVVAKPKPTVAAKPALPALPKLDPGDRSGPILGELANGKVVVAIFFNGAAADDRAALRAVRAANRHGGLVKVHAISIVDVGKYTALTTGVQVLQAPTVLVIGPDRKARTIVGYTEVKEIDQMVSDAIRASKQKHK
jgi:hypothetical protein